MVAAVPRAAHALALNGGSPIRWSGRPWPDWPQPTDADADNLLKALSSGRWALSSPYRDELFERRFAAAFAAYTGTRHCVPTDHGSSALIIAMESLRLDFADRVLVPALTWVASATAVLRAGLLPVLVDVDPDTGCMAPETIDRESEARALIAVHWACSMADVPALSRWGAARDIAVIEDAAQAHGARWNGRRAGSLGQLGCFSMQHAKVLTGGEGGAVVTDDDALSQVLEELRADSRSYRAEPRAGELELAETASMMGSNFCMDEFSAALLCAQLEQLDRQHEVRNRNYCRLAALLRDTPGVRLLRRPPEQDQLSLYEVPLIFYALPADVDNVWLASALSAELRTRVYTPRVPLSRSNLLQPLTKPSIRPLAERFMADHRDRRYPGAERLARTAVLLHHSNFLGGEEDMADIAAAVEKVMQAIRR